ncbi:DUF6504 family protein [Pelotomaculum propionicicum]|uniref:DUF6504 domain-containing protein n=1 Tax=Pelotomaculum propionicicum TaxID=258475 RepID=A0A4Y7RKJ4_9FIRM|nr:DUF6504 family protein [Pelotomaculum propionicicum]NLI12955.1 hypothetical protein [Peptococcaceae bacterium]TEB09346.1 hypothetical protein Pmgp_03216 [Pelotomaculum propionicicum]
MTKLYRSPVQVELDANKQPKRFRWLGRWYRIFNCAVYEEAQYWWSRFREPEPVRYRCETYQGLVCDLYYEKAPGTWILERVWD